MRFFHEPSKQIPVAHEVDVVVAGGGDSEYLQLCQQQGWGQKQFLLTGLGNWAATWAQV